MKRCTRIAVARLIGYREWTESLGNDREWRIQEVQAELYLEAQKTASRLGGFVLPLRYDYMLLVTSSLDEDNHREIYEVYRALSPVPVSMASSCRETPLEAESEASRLVALMGKGGLRYLEAPGREHVVAMHIDINDFTGRIWASAYGSYGLVASVMERLRSGLDERGGIISYLGGDNIVAFIPLDVIPHVHSLLDGDLKAGIGIGCTARKALERAAEALHEIRMSGDKAGRVMVRGELGDC